MTTLQSTSLCLALWAISFPVAAFASPRNIYGVGTMKNPSGVTGKGNVFGVGRMTNPSGVSRSRNLLGVPRKTGNLSGVRSSPLGNGSGIGRNIVDGPRAIQNSFGVGQGYFGSSHADRKREEEPPLAPSEENFPDDSEQFPEDHDHTTDIFTHF